MKASQVLAYFFHWVLLSISSCLTLTLFEPRVYGYIPVHHHLHQGPRRFYLYTTAHCELSSRCARPVPSYAAYRPHPRQQSRPLRQVAHKVVAEAERRRVTESHQPPRIEKPPTRNATSFKQKGIRQDKSTIYLSMNTFGAFQLMNACD